MIKLTELVHEKEYMLYACDLYDQYVFQLEVQFTNGLFNSKIYIINNEDVKKLDYGELYEYAKEQAIRDYI